jgi:hypothetical protein
MVIVQNLTVSNLTVSVGGPLDGALLIPGGSVSYLASSNVAIYVTPEGPVYGNLGAGTNYVLWGFYVGLAVAASVVVLRMCRYAVQDRVDI